MRTNNKGLGLLHQYSGQYVYKAYRIILASEVCATPSRQLRNGFQPEFNLVYSTGNGNGSFGPGCAMSIPGVSRKTSKGVTRYDDECDVFILYGAEDSATAYRISWR